MNGRIVSERIVRRKNASTITSILQETSVPGLFMESWTIGENNYVVIDNGKVVRGGVFATASEAKAVLKPEAPESLYLKVGGGA